MSEKSEICEKCGSEKIIPEVKAIDYGDYQTEGNLEVSIDENPHALMFKNRVRSNIFAKICGDCGYTEFYAKHPQALYSAYQNQKKNSSQ